MARTLTHAVTTILSPLATIIIAIPLGLGFLNALHPALDSLGHFRVHLAILMIVAALPMVAGPLLRLGALAILAATVAIATASGTVPVPGLGMGYGAVVPVRADQPVYRLLQLNLRYNNSEPGLVLSLIGRMQPDVVTLDEVSAPWAEKLDLVKAAYPHRILCPYPNGLWGVAILSRRPFAPDTEPHCDRRGAFAVARVEFGGTPIDVAALHLGWPWPFGQFWEIGGLTPYFEALSQTALLAGDFNATPWSHAVERVRAAGDLRLMPSQGATWMTRHVPRWLAFAGLPIDQVMSKGSVEVHSIRLLDDVGSDHRPVLVEISLKPDIPPGDERQTATAAASGLRAWR